MARAQIISITFTSGKCYYCDNPWKYRLEVMPLDSETKEPTGSTIDIYVCEECKETRTEKFKDRMTVVLVREVPL